MGKVYKYGMKLRGFAPDAQPRDGWLDTEIDPLEEYWNILVYARKLTDGECARYGLDYLGSREKVDL